MSGGKSRKRALAFSPDGRDLILGTQNGVVHSYNRTSHQLTAKQFELRDALFTIKYVNEGKQFSVVGCSKLAILEADTWRHLRLAEGGKSVTLLAHEILALSIAHAADGLCFDRET